jgi:hypothetical protein
MNSACWPIKRDTDGEFTEETLLDPSDSSDIWMYSLRKEISAIASWTTSFCFYLIQVNISHLCFLFFEHLLLSWYIALKQHDA